LFASQTELLTADGAGVDAHWPSAAKNGFGTSTSLESKVWFTLSNGVMTEVFYPRLDTPNTQSLRFIFCDAGVCKDEETEMTHSLQVLDERALTFEQKNATGNVLIKKTYTADVQRSTVLIEVDTQSSSSNSTLYVYYDPSLKNSGMHDTAWTSDGVLLASDDNIASALTVSTGFQEVSNEYAGDGNELFRRGYLRKQVRAANGNVVQIAQLRDHRKFTVALAFAPTPNEAAATARASLEKGFDTCRREYEAGWHAYLSSLKQFKSNHASQLNMATMVLKGLEDKTYRGAFIASPSTPWGGGPNANEPTVSGYHAVWSRDLYQIATALAAVGDVAAANRALDYLFTVQQRSDGSFPQNSWLDGRPIGRGLQMDEVALPIVLAFQLGRTDRKTWKRHIKPAADFIVTNGPVTVQDRWEEESGYSPATIAAEIAALVCASDVAIKNRDLTSSRRYLKTADYWEEAIEKWTATSTGPYHDGHYYLRLTETGDPNKPLAMKINSGGGTYDQRSIVDTGFLELVRLGIRRPNDPLIRKSVEVVDSTIKLNTPIGPGWYRYNHDAYGERPDGRSYDGSNGVGRLWTLLTGERGEYELALGHKVTAGEMLDAMARFANDGLMIPEQVWDRTADGPVRFSIGTGTGSATPLAWSMAQFIRLAVNIEHGLNIETPQVLWKRYNKTSISKNQ
jgi:glucoamylase